MSEGDNGKDKGKVVSISDRRASTSTQDGQSPEVKEPEPAEVPTPPPAAPKETDPRDLIKACRGKVQDIVCRRAVMLVDGRADLLLRKMAGYVVSTQKSFGELLEIVEQVLQRQDAMEAWFRRPPWRRWFRRPPPLPVVRLLADGSAVQVIEGPATVANATLTPPDAEPVIGPQGMPTDPAPPDETVH